MSAPAWRASMGPRAGRRAALDSLTMDGDRTEQEWILEFEAAARRSLEQRLRYAFISTYKPVMDDAPYRSFNTTADYRRWCEENLPPWLGYGRAL